MTKSTAKRKRARQVKARGYYTRPELLRFRTQLDQLIDESAGPATIRSWCDSTLITLTDLIEILIVEAPMRRALRQLVANNIRLRDAMNHIPGGEAAEGLALMDKNRALADQLVDLAEEILVR